MPYEPYSPDQIESKGEAIYSARLRDKVQPEHRGQFLVMDIETGEYEIDKDDLTATKRLLTRRPNAVVYGLRIGHPTAYRLGQGFAAHHS